MRVTASFSIAAVILASAPNARADAVATCDDAYVKAQEARKDHRLIEARDALRVCAQATCRSFIVKDCSAWFDQVQAAVPTVVPLANSRDGSDLLDVTVSLDGKVIVWKTRWALHRDQSRRAHLHVHGEGWPRAGQAGAHHRGRQGQADHRDVRCLRTGPSSRALAAACADCSDLRLPAREPQPRPATAPGRSTRPDRATNRRCRDRRGRSGRNRDQRSDRSRREVEVRPRSGGDGKLPR